MPWDLGPDELSKWMRQCFECPLVGQVQTNVLPQLERLGGPAGLCVKLKTASNTGICASEVGFHSDLVLVNRSEPRSSFLEDMSAANMLDCFTAQTMP